MGSAQQSPRGRQAEPMDHTQFAARVACTAGEYQGCFCKTTSPPASAPRWSPPPEDMIKFNVDGAFIEDGMQGGWGVVARDHTGEVVAARAGRVDHAADAFSTELVAVIKLNACPKKKSGPVLLAVFQRNGNYIFLTIVILRRPKCCYVVGPLP